MQVIVLGKIDYAIEQQYGTAVLSNTELNDVAGWVMKAISPDLEMRKGGAETYRRVRARRNGEASEALMTSLPNELDAVTELQVGVYHHRIIMVFDLNVPKPSLNRIRSLRQHVSIYARRIFNEIILLSDGIGQIANIVAYPLVLVPNGQRLIRAEDAQLVQEEFHQIFSTTTTTFTLRVRETNHLWNFRKHIFRVSVPSTVVYLAGKSISNDLLDSITDAVYYGALYSQATLAHELPIDVALAAEAGGSGAVPHMTLGTNDHLVRVVDMLQERVVNSERSEFETRVLVGTLVAGAIAVLLSTGSILSQLLG